MFTIALWAINGIGMGHTVRISHLASGLSKQNIRVKIICEHESQRLFLKSELPLVSILTIPRPWKLSGLSRTLAETKVKKFLSGSNGIVGDMGLIVDKSHFAPLLPEGTNPVFLLRWMTPKRWKTAAERLRDYKDANAVVVMHRLFFEDVTSITGEATSGLATRLHFTDGFIHRESSACQNSYDTVPNRIGFCCGAGGVHSRLGLEELKEVLWGLSYVRQELGSQIKIDAWVGRNEELREIASGFNIFDRIIGWREQTKPDWNDYSIIVGRCGYNTFTEIMRSNALLVTGAFESDDEWNNLQLSRLSKYGVIPVDTIRRMSFAQAICTSYSKVHSLLEAIRYERERIAANGLPSLIEILLRLFRIKNI